MSSPAREILRLVRLAREWFECGRTTYGQSVMRTANEVALRYYGRTLRRGTR